MYLGVTVSGDLRLYEHVNNVSAKAAKVYPQHIFVTEKPDGYGVTRGVGPQVRQCGI